MSKAQKCILLASLWIFGNALASQSWSPAGVTLCPAYLNATQLINQLQAHITKAQTTFLLSPLQEVVRGIHAMIPHIRTLGDNPAPIQVAFEDIDQTAMVLHGVLEQFTRTQVPLQEFAEKMGYGYKTANLEQLKRLFAGMPGVVVPTFMAASSFAIQNILKAGGLDIAERWQKIWHDTDEAGRQTIRTNKKFPEKIVGELEQLEKDIKAAFNALAAQISPATFHALFDPNVYPGILGWLASARARGIKLMVRSSGREDTTQVANAGGNVSKRNIQAIIAAVVSAMGDTVSSYFSLNSLMQRLGVGDEQLFDVPLMPVLLQEMVGEQTGQKIPSAGVMFTEEPEGGLSYQREHEKGFHGTTGITIIQATFGHNEGVVNGLVPVDTFYVLADNSIYTVIREKGSRIVPERDEPIENPSNLISKASLPRKIVLRLKKIAANLEAFYAMPMDVEFVYNPQTETIALVQARPITYKKNMPPACFLKNIEAFAKQYQDRSLPCTTIGFAGGSLRCITNKGQLVHAKTLRQARIKYFKSPDTAKIECIVVAQMAPSTSHEATTLRGEGKPVVCLGQNYEQCKKWLKQESYLLVVDPQQGFVLNWPDNKRSLAELRTAELVGDGWLRYPIPSELSVGIPQLKVPPLSIIIEEIQQRTSKSDYERYKQQISAPALIGQESTEKKLWFSKRQLLACMAQADEAVARIALLNLLRQLNKEEPRIASLSSGGMVDPQLLAQMRLLNKIAGVCARQIEETLHYPAYDPRRLCALRFLQILLYQDPAADVVNGYSFKKTYADIKTERAIRQRGFSEPVAIQLARVSYAGFTEQTRQKWDNFVKALQEIEEKVQLKSQRAGDSPINRCTHLIKKLAELHLITLWLHTSFEKEYKSENALETLVLLEHEYRESEAFLSALLAQRQKIASFKTDAFEDPNSFEGLHRQLVNLLPYFIDEQQFCAAFKASKQLGTLAALELMRTVIEKCDSAAKALEGSTKYQDKQKHAENFRTLLRTYFGLLERWVCLLPTAPSRHWGRCRGYQPNEVLGGIRKALGENIDPEVCFSAGACFNASRYIIDRVYFVGMPQTLDDAFTAIHQNLLSIIASIMNNTQILSTSVLPKEIKTLHEIFVKTRSVADQGLYNIQTLSCIGFAVNDNTICFSYNVPLKAHSLVMDVLFDNRLNTFQATCDFAGYMACFQRRALLPTCTQIGKLLYGIDSTLTASTALRISFSMQFTAELIGQFAVLVDILCGLTRPDDGTWKGKFDAFVQKSPISKIPELLNFLIFDSTEYSAAFVNYGNIGFDWLNTLKQSPQPQTQLCTLMFGTNTNEEDNRLKILIQEHVDQLDAVFSRLINQFKKGVRGTVEFIASLNRKLQSLLPSDSLQKRIFQESCAIAQQVSNTKEHRLSVEAKDLLKELSGATH